MIIIMILMKSRQDLKCVKEGKFRKLSLDVQEHMY